MSAFIRYVAVVCLAIALTAVLAGSDELARSDWPGDTDCSSNATHSIPGATRAGIDQKKKTFRDLAPAARCTGSFVGELTAALENT